MSRAELKQMVTRSRHVLTKKDKSDIVALLYGEEKSTSRREKNDKVAI